MADAEKRSICRYVVPVFILFIHYSLNKTPALLTMNREELGNFVRSLPYLTAADIGEEEACPICLSPLEQILHGRGKSEAPQSSQSEAPAEHVGVTKLPGCGHIFCRIEYVSLSSPSGPSHLMDTPDQHRRMDCWLCEH